MSQTLWHRLGNGDLEGLVVVQDNGCMIWKRATNSQGYPVIRDPSRAVTMLATRRLLEWKTGDAGSGKEACHSCDTPSCMNPHHLRWDSHKQNIRECVQRGRQNSINQFLRRRV